MFEKDAGPRGSTIDLTGKTALVTGAGWWPAQPLGIGGAIALAMATAGATVLVNDVNEAAACRVQQAIHEMGGRSEVTIGSVADAKATEVMVAQARTLGGGLDILVSAAALTMHKWGNRRFHEISASECQEELDVTLSGVLNCTRAALPIMIQQGRGSIIAIASASGLHPAPRFSVYGLAKAAVIHFTTSVAAEAGPYGVRANAICPGPTETRVTGKLQGTKLDRYLERVPLGRLGQPPEIANVALFLASDLSSFVNGAVIEATGGWIP